VHSLLHSGCLPRDRAQQPGLVAQRVARFASVVGKGNVIASTDCGFGTSAAGDDLHPDVAWAKLGALMEGARIASRQLFKRGPPQLN
jgi:5-methyltetrahydropteroyltriglutamate--homocysteine methyltransferase